MSVEDGYIEVIQGDITRQRVDAIVNAANSSLLGGGGVDGAIHRVAGRDLLDACQRIGGCPPGEARITPGFYLPAKSVIHTVGPMWRGGGQGEDETLAQCYRNSMSLASQHHVRSIAFPSISTGAYGFPVERAAPIAVRELRDAVARYPDVETARVVCFGGETYAAYERTMEDLLD